MHTSCIIDCWHVSTDHVVYERDVPIEEVEGPIYLLREDKTPLSQRFHETVAISTTPGYDRYYEGTQIEYFNDRWYVQEVRFLPGIPPRKTFSSTVFYIPVNGKKHIWFREAVHLRFDLPRAKTFSTKVLIYPRRKVESQVSGVEHTDEKLIKYYRVAVDLQLRDYVSLELVPLDQ
ncbi:hypothetical protein BSL78_02828 [Apostichopus japonicus]|uniref:Uncharacterized protein n=1 Tax=Stichopus japonicus TaxID=307972 RepID=A0A2G8LJ29_STIJA|nr:hypothetical protein BSL78_02828 [Apostichopus japonicus]